MRLFFLPFAWFWLCAVAQKTPTISYISPDVVTDIGGQVNLTCRIKDGREYPILWMRLGASNFPISTGPGLLIPDKRFTLQHEEKTGTYSLTIKDVRPADAAPYQCQVVVSLNNMITADVALQVKLPPTMVDTTPKRVTAVVGEKAEMTCEAKGFPKPSMTWSREDKLPLSSGVDEEVADVFQVKKVRMEDRGNYVCYADNGVGQGQSRIVTLEVEFSPTVEVPRPRTPQASGYDAELECKITAFPPPSIIWKKDNQSLNNNENRLITHFALQEDVTRSTLKIMSMEGDMFGQYTCEASNRYGKDEQVIEVYESKIPICPPVCGDIQLDSAGSAMVNSGIMAVVLMGLTFTALMRGTVQA